MKIFHKTTAVVAILFLLCSYSNVNAQSVPTKTIYFLAGPKDHAGEEGSGRHETRRDLLVLQHCIDSISNLKGVKIVTKFSYKRDALNIDDLKGVDAIIIECSAEGSSKERAHPIFPPSNPGDKSYDKATLDYLAKVDSLHKAGMGIMVLHWGITTTNQKATQYYLSWFGSASMSGYTRNPLGFWEVKPIEAAKNHPILRGVGPFNYKDEIFSRMLVNPGDPYRTDLLTGTIQKSNQGAAEPLGIATAYDKNGARGMLWGGMDYHSALLNDNYRRFVLNAILWTAGVDVPAGGVKSTAKQLQLSAAKADNFDALKPEGFVLK
ncbi:hypothetical protein [Mucilaginibacter auburnensis]|uniref:Trehalose utilization protein n=1 Tax=Mucilaginibacter auburnensis TaxID=1457233 RepID=A0A2H9VQQ7_9SPHI|nr:hypothetical protein [Mucilaginibacter auburnensis]PJJ83098.1 hypothetical protein CLV57_0076 [Mucilaginibacter auburnensis]